VKDLRQREEGLAARQRQLESRTQELGGRERRQAQENAAVDLVELEATIAGKQKELDEEVKTREREIRDLDKQINSKRSLLNRVLGRDGESP
jgi:phage repressor protein C with HTH and peptisase S24 domain